MQIPISVAHERRNGGDSTAADVDRSKRPGSVLQNFRALLEH
jgi:hypothetical protein